METSERASIVELAAAHGLQLEAASLAVNELGLDFKVAIGSAPGGERWVLRIPRRPDVIDRAKVEGEFLKRIGALLAVAIPDWKIHTDELIAYPLLPGEPGLTLGSGGEPQWHFDVESPAYAHSLGDFLAQLHGIDRDLVAGSGIEVFTPSEVRQRKRDDIKLVTAEFEVAEHLQDRWAAWLNDDRYWAGRSAVTHGEIYPAHQLMAGERIVGILDWTTAAVSDPARDFIFHQASVSPKAFDATVARYVARGGEAEPLLAEHCAAWFSSAAVDYGLFALNTAEPEHRQAAAAQLNP